MSPKTADRADAAEARAQETRGFIHQVRVAEGVGIPDPPETGRLPTPLISNTANLSHLV